MRKNSQNTNAILDKLRALMIKHVVEKSKEAGSFSDGGSILENRAPQSASLDNRGLLLDQKENQPIPAKIKAS